LKLREKKGLIADINLSPILDLSLMLVIFLAVTTEFISGGEIKVQVPKGGAAINATTEAAKVIIDKWGKIYYQGKEYKDPLELVKVLPKDRRIFIKADKETPYQFVFNLLDTMRKVGIKKVSLVGKRVE
jgi:biopolymer transport protein ExbD